MNLQYNNSQLMTLSSFDSSVYSMTRLFDSINSEVSNSTPNILSTSNTSITAKFGTVTAVYTGIFSQSPATVNSIKLTSGISQITGAGNVFLNVSTGDFSGAYTNFTATSGTKNLVMQGVFNVDIFGDVNNVNLTSFDVSADGYRLKFSGNILADDNFNLTGGTITSFIISDSSGRTISGDNLSISALQFDSFTDPQNSSNLNSFNGLFTYLNSPSLLTGNDSIIAGTGNDTLNGGLGNDILDGGLGVDTAVFNINRSAVIEVRHTKTGGAYILSSEGADTLTSIENLQFLDGTLSVGNSGDVIRDLIASRPLPTFAGAASAPTLYTGGVAFLEYQYIGTSSGDTVTGSTGNDFMNLGLGDDAANGGAGDDVLDGGVGSNFLSGGGGNDTLYLDGRGGTNTWATITDFNSGDAVNIWGWNAGISKLLLTQASNGAAGFTGVTYHYDLDNNGVIDTSITFTGLTSAQIPTSQALSVTGNGYLLVG